MYATNKQTKLPGCILSKHVTIWLKKSLSWLKPVFVQGIQAHEQTYNTLVCKKQTNKQTNKQNYLGASLANMSVAKEEESVLSCSKKLPFLSLNIDLFLVDRFCGGLVSSVDEDIE